MSHIPKIDDVLAGRYTIVDLLQHGQQTVTFLATDLRTNRLVIIKLPAFPKGHPNYPREAARLRRSGGLKFNDPRIVDPFDVIDDGNLLAVVFPYVDGVDLRRHVHDQGGCLAVHQAVELAVQLTKALRTVHDRGSVHRDLKPDNVLLPQGSTRPMLIDFGLSRDLRVPTLSDSSGWLGTPAYMPPEQCAPGSPVDHRADLFALGGVLYFMLTGESAAQEQDPAAALQTLEHWTPIPPSRLRPEVPSTLDRVVLRLMARDPRDRHPSASDVLDDLARCRAGSTCRGCGTTLAPSARFCISCGASTQANHLARCLACGGEFGGSSSCSSCGRFAAPEFPSLVFERGPLTGSTFAIPLGEYAVGREELCPRDHYLSRRQLLVICRDNAVHVRDGGGANTTIVNQRPALAPVQLVPHSRVRLGVSDAVFRRGACPGVHRH